MAYFIRTDSIASGWEQLCKKIILEGQIVSDERGTRTKELLNVMVEITNPSSDKESVYSFWKGEHLRQYEKQFLSPSNEGDFVYTYGNRLRDYFGGLDQVMECVRVLRMCRESRRAVCVTWDPLVDLVSDEVPCLVLVDFLVRDGFLFTNACWRSHDVFGAWYANLFGLRALSLLVADSVMEGMRLGGITVRSVSAHVYESDWGVVEGMLK